MVAGASGIDLFLLVIDAAEGARPQTHEHLAILRLLGIEHSVVALTKADAVEEETLELARVEAEELVPGAPVVATSARTGAGLDELRAALAEVAGRVARHDAGGPARLHVDRSFTLRGIGTVATGTLWSGTIGEGDELWLEPRGRTVRVRSVQVHDRGVERAEAGQRVAASLPGVERQELRRGDVLVTPGALRPSFRLDVMLELLGDPAGSCSTTAPRDGRPRRARGRPLRPAAPRGPSSPRVATASCCVRERRSGAASSRTRIRRGTLNSPASRRSSAAGPSSIPRSR
jgi:selenocysteine-specific elongation factor